MARGSRSALGSVLARPGMRRLLAGQAVSGIGDWMATVALLALVLEVSGSSTAVAGILVLRLAPSVVAGPATARVVGRWDRRRTMLAMDAVRAGIAIAVPLVHHLWWVYVWAFCLEAAGLVFLPARDAAIPELADPEDLPIANGLVLGSSYGTIPIGAALFGIVHALSGHHGYAAMVAVFAVDAATFIVSFVMIARIRDLRGYRDAAPETTPRFRDAFHLPLVHAMVLPAAMAALGIGTLFSLGIVFVRDVLGASDTQFGVLVMLFGVGAAVGIGVLQVTRAKGMSVVIVAVAAQGAVIALMSLSNSLALAFLGAAGFGAATAATLASAMSVLQDELEERDRVVAFAAFHVIIRGGLALSAVAAGVAADLVSGVRWPLVGRLPPARVVLLCSGVLIVGSAAVADRVRVRSQDAQPGTAQSETAQSETGTA